MATNPSDFELVDVDIIGLNAARHEQYETDVELIELLLKESELRYSGAMLTGFRVGLGAALNELSASWIYKHGKE